MNDTKKILKDLNKEQLNIVKSDENLYVTACPGSGKTRVLTRKIAYQHLKYNESLKKIIAITYTNRAAEEIKDRLDLLGLDNTETIWVGTIHQFCLEFIIYPFKMNIPRISKGFTIIDQYSQREYIQQLNNELKLDLGFLELNKIDLTLSMDLEVKEKKYFEFSNAYHNKLEANKEIDFDMILLMAFKILCVNSNVSRNIANNIRAIYVDEFQDTRELQYKILAKLFKCNTEIQSMFVGDMDQAIYGSLEGVAKPVNELQELTRQTFKTATLHGCYRSSQRIVDFYSNFQEEKYSIESRGCNRNTRGHIEYKNSINKDELPHLIKNIITDRIEHGVSENDICIVAPQHYILFSLGEFLREELPNYNFDAVTISPIKVNDHSMFFKLAILCFTEAGKKSRRRKRVASDIIRILTNEFGVDLTDDFLNLDLLQFINKQKNLYSGNNGVELYQFVTEGLLDYLGILKKSYLPIFKQYNLFIQEVESRIESNNLSNTITSFQKMFKIREGITITTAHKVKGNEYDTVIAINLLKGRIPHWNEVYHTQDKGVDSSRKLLYVICSRAKNNLYLFSEEGYTTGNGQPLEPTNLLNKVQFEYDTHDVKQS